MTDGDTNCGTDDCATAEAAANSEALRVAAIDQGVTIALLL